MRAFAVACGFPSVRCGSPCSVALAPLVVACAPAFVRHSGAAGPLRLRLLPSPRRARRARRRFAGPVRRFRPRAFSALAGPAPRPLRPRLRRSALACALARSAGARCRRAAAPCPRCAAGLPCGRPCCARARVCGCRRSPLPLGAARLRGFGGGCLRPGAVGGAVRRLFPALAPGLAARALPVACCRSVAAAVLRRGVLPCAPPVPAAPAGGSGEAGCLRLGAAAPAASQLPRGLARCCFPVLSVRVGGIGLQVARQRLARPASSRKGDTERRAALAGCPRPCCSPCVHLENQIPPNHERRFHHENHR